MDQVGEEKAKLGEHDAQSVRKIDFDFDEAAKNYRLAQCIGKDKTASLDDRVEAWITASGIAGAITRNYRLSWFGENKQKKLQFGKKIFPCLHSALDMKDSNGRPSQRAIEKYADAIAGMLDSNFKASIEESLGVNLKNEKKNALDIMTRTGYSDSTVKTRLSRAGE